MQRGGLAGVVAQHAEYALLGGAGAADRGAHVERVQRTQFVEIRFDQIGELQKQRLPLIRLDLAPRPFEGATGGGDRKVDILGIAFGHYRQQLAGGGIVGLESLAGCGIDPFAVDQHFLVGAIRVGMACHWYRLRHSHVISPLRLVSLPTVIFLFI
jgi:hypothetical protein